ncbi:MAG: cysteine-rich CWC family protein [Flammeovirgaceae bacterium]
MLDLITKKCANCHRIFECNANDITQCQCYGIVLSPQAKELLQKSAHSDCLCRVCLEELEQQVKQTKELPTTQTNGHR